MSIERGRPHIDDKAVGEGSSRKENVVFPQTVEFGEADNKELESAKWLVASRYSEHNPYLSEDDVYKKFYKENNKRPSITLVASETESSRREVIATLQLTYGEDIDALHLMHMHDEYAHVPGSTIGEFGRFAIKKHVGHREFLLTELTKKGLEIANEREIPLERVYAIMPNMVKEYYSEGGIDVQQVPGATLREESNEAKEVFDMFPRYWRHWEPRLYIYPETLLEQYRRHER